MAVARCRPSAEKSGRSIATPSVTAVASPGLGCPVTSIISEASGYRAAFWLSALAVALALALVVTPGAAGLSVGAVRCRAGVPSAAYCSWS
jgi:predicted MFS family arabinose efflux permease